MGERHERNPDEIRRPLTLPVIGIFDIGKTNKKFLLFDNQFNVVHKTEITLPEIVDEDGFPCEDLTSLVSWIRQCVNDVSDNRRYRLFELNYSTYGASLVHVNERGDAVAPLYSYFKPYPENLLDEFYQTYGGKSDFALTTASPPMGMLNSGLQLYWLKKTKPELFRQIERSLHFPQYVSYLFTGKPYSEMTSIGCHTGLWDFNKNNYHEWVVKESVDRLLPGIMAPSARLRILYRHHALDSGIGIHDSSASLAPYLLCLEDPFILVSTGTWSISLNPFSRTPLSYDELKRDCLQYIDIRGSRVKASRFLLGGEFDFQLEKIKQQFNTKKFTGNARPDTTILGNMLIPKSVSGKLILEKSINSGPYPQNGNREWNPGYYKTPVDALHRLLLDLASIQAESINLAAGKSDTRKIIVTGGFSKNELFVRLLASMFPEKEVYTSALSDSTALGAALVINQNDVKKPNGKTVDLLGLKRIDPLQVTGLDKYSWKG